MMQDLAYSRVMHLSGVESAMTSFATGLGNQRRQRKPDRNYCQRNQDLLSELRHVYPLRCGVGPEVRDVPEHADWL